MLIRCRYDRAEVSDFLRQWQTERIFPRMRWVKCRFTKGGGGMHNTQGTSMFIEEGVSLSIPGF